MDSTICIQTKVLINESKADHQKRKQSLPYVLSRVLVVFAFCALNVFVNGVSFLDWEEDEASFCIVPGARSDFPKPESACAIVVAMLVVRRQEYIT